MCKEILIWTKQDHLKARQLCRLVPNERSFFSKFPVLLSTEQAIHLQQQHPKEHAAFIRQNTAQEQPSDPALARQLILQRDLKIKKAKKIEASHHNVQITTDQPPIDPSEYACLFITKRISPSTNAKTENPLDSIALPIQFTVKQRAFSMLTQRGFYLADGSKFGGDFLVYDADPASSSNHSKWIALVLQSPAEMSQSAFVRHARLATFTGKRLMVVTQDCEEALVMLEYSFAFA